MSFASSSSSSSTDTADFTALFDVFVPFFAAASFLVVEALRDAVLIANVLGAVDFAVDAFVAVVSVVVFRAIVFVEAFGAVVFAAEDFVVATRAEVETFDTELFSAGFGAAALGAGFGAGSSSVFFGLPRRTGALRMLALGGDSGGPPFACARCARVRTMLGFALGLRIIDVVDVEMLE